MHALYLLINLCSVLVPLLFSFNTCVRLDKEFGSMIKVNLIVFTLPNLIFFYIFQVLRKKETAQ